MVSTLSNPSTMQATIADTTILAYMSTVLCEDCITAFLKHAWQLQPSALGAEIYRHSNILLASLLTVLLTTPKTLLRLIGTTGGSKLRLRFRDGLAAHVHLLPIAKSLFPILDYCPCIRVPPCGCGRLQACRTLQRIGRIEKRMAKACKHKAALPATREACTAKVLCCKFP